MVLQIAFAWFGARRRPARPGQCHTFVASAAACVGAFRRRAAERRAERELMRLDDHLLRDIGLNREALCRDPEAIRLRARYEAALPAAAGRRLHLLPDSQFTGPPFPAPPLPAVVLSRSGAQRRRAR